MKKRELLKRTMWGVLLTLVCICSFSSRAEAKKINIKGTRTVTIEAGESYTIPFRVSQSLIFATPIEYKLNETSDGKLKIRLYDSNNKMLQNDTITYEGCEEYEWYSNWFYSDGFKQKPGEYKYVFKNTSGYEDVKIKVSIKGYTKVAQNAKIKKAVTVKSGDCVKIGKVNTDGLPTVKSFSIGGSECLDYARAEANGDIYIWGYMPGNCTLKVNLWNGKTYKTKVTVTPPDNNFQAELWNYDTRENRLTIRIKNKGMGTLTIQPRAKMCDKDYKCYDRNVHISGYKKVNIPAGKTKFITFKVSGSVSWPVLEDYWLDYQFTYYGKTYQARAYYDAEESAYKKYKNKSGWYYTYYGDYWEE